MTYSDCDSGGRGIDKFLPLLSTLHQPSVNFTVCAYGGVSGFTCGEIVESGVTITVHVPSFCQRKTAQFFNVTKVQMNKPYSSGDLGAPVYITLLIPNTTQVVADPVGQVVENVGDNSEKNV